MTTSPKLDTPIRPFSCAALESALQDYKRGDAVEALLHTLEAAERIAQDLKAACNEGGEAEDVAESILWFAQDALNLMPDAKRYFDQEQEERAVRV